MRFTKNSSQANRGRFLEEMIRASNDRYRHTRAGKVEKFPTEWIPLRGSTGQIENAKVDSRNKGVPDFMGAFVVTGAVAFDTKETAKGIRFPLDKLEPEQFEWMLEAYEMGTHRVFTLHYFHEIDKAFLLPFEVTARFYLPWYKQGGSREVPASIPGDVFTAEAYRVKPGRALVLDYLEALTQYQADTLDNAPGGQNKRLEAGKWMQEWQGAKAARNLRTAGRTTAGTAASKAAVKYPNSRTRAKR